MKLFYFIYKWARTLIPGEYSFCGLCMVKDFDMVLKG